MQVHLNPPPTLKPLGALNPALVILDPSLLWPLQEVSALTYNLHIKVHPEGASPAITLRSGVVEFTCWFHTNIHLPTIQA